MTKFAKYLGVKLKPGAHLDFLETLEARNSDGSGNNVANGGWGKAHAAFVRATPNSYPDGIGVEWDLPINVRDPSSPGFGTNIGTGSVGDMPRPRDITDLIMAQPQVNGVDKDLPSSAGINEYFQFFGQFLTHDVAEAELVGANGVVADGPPLFIDGLPFPFNRTPDADGNPSNGNVRQQANEETSYLDLSQVYGSSDDILGLLRARNGDGSYSAKMLMGASDNLLPTLDEVLQHHKPYDPGLDAATVTAILDVGAGFAGSDPNDFGAGDNRVNQQPHLVSHHMLWMRNHNWHVDQLKAAYPSWSDAELFEAARALNEAEWQNVVYSEYMAKLVGPKAIDAYSGYKTNVNAGVINEWTTVAFRFGHDESSNNLGAMNENGSIARVLTLGEAFSEGADAIRSDVALNQWIRGQLARYTQEIDGKVVEGNRNLLFGIPGAVVDLEVFDIQRGRDHGVARYNKLRDGLGLSKYKDFNDFAAKNKVDAATLAALKSLYNTGAAKEIDGIDRLDSIVGGLLEKKAPGSLLGETFTILNVMQFENFRDGDRMFYLNRFEDSPDLIEMIENTSLSDIILRNTDIGYVYRDAFIAHERIGGNDKNNGLKGTNKGDLMLGFKGSDKIYGNGGNDDLYGAEGHDHLYGGSGEDMLFGGKDNDKLNGDAGADLLDGGDGRDHLFGGAADDFLFGGKGNDQLYGGAGKDLLDGGEGDDKLNGGTGRDVFVFGENSGRDTVYSFAKEDKLDLSALDFASLAEVKDASVKQKDGLLIRLDDAGAQVKLLGVGWTLTSANLILDDGAFA